ncbi:MAG: DUF962 domain-containing protein [Pseudomonadota bacterium]
MVKTNDHFESFAEFYPFYLGEHSNPRSRALHYVGSSLAPAISVAALIFGPLWLLFTVPVAGYLFAWIGHFFLERNKPATFKHPLWSLMGDYKMLWQALTGTLDTRHFHGHS